MPVDDNGRRTALENSRYNADSPCCLNHRVAARLPTGGAVHATGRSSVRGAIDRRDRNAPMTTVLNRLRGRLTARSGTSADTASPERPAPQAQLNPAPLAVMVENRAVFHHLAQAAGLPVPRLLATLVHAGSGWDAVRGVAVERGDWHAALDAAARDLVVTPALGAAGRDVRALHHVRGGWLNGGGGSLTSREVARQLADHPRVGTWLVHERVPNHPSLDRLSRSRQPQPVRAVTLVDDGGTVRITSAALRVTPLDEAAACVWVRVDPRSGSPLAGYVATPMGSGYRQVDHEPAIGTPLAEVRVPLWDEVAAVAMRTAEAFLPLRSLAMDITVSPDGPVLVGAACRWEPHPGEPLRDPDPDAVAVGP